MEASYTTKILKIQSGNHELWGKLFVPKRDTDSRFPAVVLCHGFGGSYKETEPNAEFLAMHGFVTYVFDFYGGSPDSLSGGSMLDMTLFTERDDLLSVVRTIRSLSCVDPSEFFLLGGSLGGAVCAVTAPLIKNEIRAMVLLYPALNIVHLIHSIFPEEKDITKTFRIGYWTISSSYAKVVYNLDLPKLIAQYTGPVQIIHGTADTIVPDSFSIEAEKVYKDAQLILLPGGVHGLPGEPGKIAQQYFLLFLEDQLKEPDQQA